MISDETLDEKQSSSNEFQLTLSPMRSESDSILTQGMKKFSISHHTKKSSKERNQTEMKSNEKNLNLVF